MQVAAVVAEIASGHTVEVVAKRYGLPVETVQGFIGYRPGRSKPKCGTDSGYASHRRKGEEPCAKCKKAHSDYLKRYTKGRRKA